MELAELQKKYGGDFQEVKDHIQELEEKIQQERMKDPLKRYTSLKARYESKAQKVERAKKKHDEARKEYEETHKTVVQEEEGLGALKAEMEEAQKALGDFVNKPKSKEEEVKAAPQEQAQPTAGGVHTEATATNPMDTTEPAQDQGAGEDSGGKVPRKDRRSRSPKRDPKGGQTEPSG